WEASPGEPEPEVGVKAAACQLEVVRENEEDTDGHEQCEPGPVAHRADEPDPAGDADRYGGQGHEDPVGNPRAERTSAQLVERVRADSDRECEGGGGRAGGPPGRGRREAAAGD